MALDLFGYNGVFELDQDVVNALLATYIYENNLVAVNNQVTDGDFIAAKTPIKDGTIRLYLELARPFLHVQKPAMDGTNLVTLHVPFSQVGAFLIQNGVPTRQQVPLLALVLFNVGVQKNDSGLTVDFSQLTGDDVGIQLIGVKAGPTGVGGAQLGNLALLDDATIENLLNKTVLAKDLRQSLADRLKDPKNSVIGPTTVPVSPGGLFSAVRSWDLRLFGNANDRDPLDAPGGAGADILLFQDAQSGRGERTDAGDTIPVAPQTPQYGWSLSLSAKVLLDGINLALDTNTYYVQGTTLNTPDNPLGYLVVPAVGSHLYALPTGAGKITVLAPNNGQSQVMIAGGGFTPNGRATLRNFDLNQELPFVADDKGAATLSIQANPGERLAFTVNAVSVPGDSSTVIWRPEISIKDGEIDASVHYYHYMKNWCDAEGNALVRLTFRADRTQPFAFLTDVIDANASAPWWSYALAWFGPALIGQEALAPVLILFVPEVSHLLAHSLIGDKVISTAKQLTDKLSRISLDNLKIVLDQVDIYETGLQLSGRADSGNILAYGRTVAYSTQPGVVLDTLDPNPVYMRFDWTPSIADITIAAGRCSVIRDKAADAFWSATYDDLPADLGRDSFVLNAGDSVMLWVEIQGFKSVFRGKDPEGRESDTPLIYESGHAKVLLERPPQGDVPSTAITVTWIAYRDRVWRSVKLSNGIKATVVGGGGSLVLSQVQYKYEGNISLATTKFFLTQETQALKDEQWFWDDQLVDEMGITQPGGTIVLDPVKRQLIVHLDQSGLVSNQDIPATHWVKFHGTDVFGTTLETKILVQTPAVVTSTNPIALNPPLGPAFINPLGDPTRDRPSFDVANQLTTQLTNLLTPQLGMVSAQSLARSLSDALLTGAGNLDGVGASALLTLLGRLAQG